MHNLPIQPSRRALMISGVTLAVGALAQSTKTFTTPAPERVSIKPPKAPAAPRIGRPNSRFDVEPKLLERALAALNRHSSAIRERDRIAIVDFDAPSSEPRLHFLDVVSGKATRMLVAHGSGSDPGHTGYLKTFSNAFGSNASSEGAFLTDDYYVGKHGRSQRLLGLDHTNNNALARAVVVHSAWYANDDMISAHGKLGRSQGCFAVGEDKLDDVFAFLGKGRMIYADRMGAA